MKKIRNKIISAILAGMMLVGSVPIAGAAYEEYLPTITGIEIGHDGDLSKCGVAYISGASTSDIHPYILVGEGMKEDFVDGIAHYLQDTNGDVDYYDLSYAAMVMSKHEMPMFKIFTGVEKGDYWAGEVRKSVLEQDSGYRLQIHKLSALDIPSLHWEATESSYEWKANLGEDYPIGSYELTIWMMDPAGYGNGRSFYGEVTATDQPLVVYGKVSQALMNF